MKAFSLSLVLFACCSSFCPAAEQVIVAQGLPQDKLVMLSPSDDGYEAALATILQGKHDALIESVKWMGVVLRNDSDRAVVAFTVRFHTDPAGPYMAPGMGYGAVEDLLDGGQRRAESRYFKRRIWVIPPGSSRFIGPHITIGQNEAINDAAQRGPAALLRIQSRLDRQRAEWQDHKVTIVLESAVFEDGEVVGPDALLTAQDTRNELTGYQSVFSDVTARASSGTSWAELMRYLEDVVNQTQGTKFGSGDYWRNFYAGRLTMIASENGVGAAVQYAAEHAFHHPPEIHVGKRWMKQIAQKPRR